MKNWKISGAVLLLILSACGGSSGGGSSSGAGNPNVGEQGDDSIPDSEVAGLIDGKEWQLRQGWADIENGRLTLTLGDEISAARCPSFYAAARRLEISAPAVLGETRLPSAGNELKAYATLQRSGHVQILNGQRARLIVSEIKADEIVASVALEFDDANRVRGQIKLPLCRGASVLTPPSPRPVPVTNPPPAPGAEERSLGQFELKASRGQGSSNVMNIGSPQAKRVFADFSFHPAQSTTLSLYRGSSSGFNCASNLQRSFTLMLLDDSGNVLDSKNYSHFPERLPLEGGQKYLLRHTAEGFGDFCNYLNLSFLAVVP